MAKIETSKAVKAHTRYTNAEGKIIPGTTTITSVLNKPGLPAWANKLGLQGIDSSKYVDEKAKIGTLAHAMIEAFLKGEECDTSEYSKVQIDKAETCLIKFWDWFDEHTIEVILCEVPLVSEVWQFGGTMDCFAKVDNQDTLLDFKTSSGIFPEMLVQLAAYRCLLTENCYRVEQCRILRIGRSEEEGFEERVLNQLTDQWEIFTHCLAIYNLQKEIRKEG